MHGQVWEHDANLLGYERQSPQQGPSHVSNGFFHPLEVAPEPTLQIGYDAVCTCSLLPVFATSIVCGLCGAVSEV